MRFEDFVLQFDTSSRGGFRARVLKSPFGEGGVGFSLPSIAGAESAALDVSGIARGARELDQESVATAVLAAPPPLQIGTELYRAIFQGQVRTLLDKSRGKLEISRDLGLRLKIKIDPSDEETGALADLPWELLCDGETEDFFGLSRQTSLVRYLDVPRSSQPIPFTPPLRILAVSASPHSLQALDLDEEMRRLDELNRSSSGVEVQFLPNASAGAVREALSDDTYNVLHFMGHGVFDRASGEGMLAFEGPGGALDLVSGKAFATKLRDLRSLGVVMLNACNTARARHQAGTNPFRGVATALVLGGVPAVVAMQRPISDRAAIGFSAAFYRHLARGDSIDEALTEGRQAIHSAKPESFEWATPVLFLRIPEGNVFVAKPAEPRAAVKPTVEAPVAPPPPLPAPTPITPAAPKRGLVIKVLAGSAGAVLVVFVLYTKVIHPSNGSAPPLDQTPSQTQGPLTSDAVTVPQHDTDRKGGDPRSNTRTEKDRQATQDQKIESSSPKPKDNVAEQTPAVTSTPEPPPVKPETVADAAPAADLSSLSMQASAERREASIQVTVIFKNTSDRRLPVTLSESASLRDDNRTYQSLGSDLPSSGRLDLAPNASSRHTFEFPLPQLGSSNFRFVLTTADGQRLKEFRFNLP